MNDWCYMNQPQPQELIVDYPDVTKQLTPHQYEMWLLQRAPDYQNVPVPSQDSMSTVSEEEAAMIRTAKSMRLAEKIRHDEEMAEHRLPDVIPQPPNPGSPSAKLRLRPNSRCFGKTKEAAITLNKKEAKEEEETPVLLTKTQKKELKKELRQELKLQHHQQHLMLTCMH